MKHAKKLASRLLAILLALALTPTLSAPARAADSGDHEGLRRLGELLAENWDKDPYGFLPSQVNGRVRLFSTDFPASYDLRSVYVNGNDTEPVSYVTPVKVQHPMDICWSFAAIAAAETSILGSGIAEGLAATADATHDELDLSEKHVSFFTYRPITDPNEPQYGEGYIFSGEEGSSEIYQGGTFFYATTQFASGVGPMFEHQAVLDSNGEIYYPFEYHGKEGKPDIYKGEALYYSADDDWWIDDDLRFGQCFRLKESFILPRPADYDVDSPEFAAAIGAIKEQLYAGRGVAYAFCADTYTPGDDTESDLFINAENWAHYTYAKDGVDRSMNHGCEIIGWDDHYPRENFVHKLDDGSDSPAPQNDGAWLVKNSWGSGENEFPNRITGDWGLLQGQDKGVYNESSGKWEYNAIENALHTGYFWLSYEDRSSGPIEAFDFEPVGGEAYCLAQHDLMPVSQASGITDSIPFKTANVFRMDQTMDPAALRLESVTCQTMTPETRVHCEVYRLRQDAETPEDGELVAQADGTYPYGGYHQLTLNTPVLFKRGEVFSVVITASIPDGQYCFGLHTNFLVPYPGGLFRTHAVVNPGESLLCCGDEWGDLSDEYVIEFILGEDVNNIVLDNFPIKARLAIPDESEIPPDAALVAPPAARTLSYTGAAQTLVTPGIAEGGTLCYSLDGLSYSATLPTATAAGEYTVYYKVVGDEAHAGTGVETLTVTIAPATPGGGGGSSGGGTSNAGAVRTETTTSADGSTATIRRDANGAVLGTETTVSEQALAEAAKIGEAVTLPVSLSAAADAASAPPVTVTLPKTDAPVRVEIPVDNLTAGTVVVLVHEDGTEEIVRTSVNSEGSVAFTLTGDAKIKVVDNTKAFADVSNDAWYADSVAWAASREIMNGTGDGFEPDTETSRAMLAQILFNLDGAEASGALADFGDVSAENWYADAVTWLVANGIAQGEGENFGAAKSVTREQLAVMLYHYARYKGCETSAAEGALDGYGDADGVSAYAREAMAWAVGAGILSGTTDGAGGVILDAGGGATRAQVAAMLERFCQNVLR